MEFSRPPTNMMKMKNEQIVKKTMLPQTRKCKKRSKLITYTFIPKSNQSFGESYSSTWMWFIHILLELRIKWGLSNTPNNKCGTNLALTCVEGGTQFLVFHDKSRRPHYLTWHTNFDGVTYLVYLFIPNERVKLPKKEIIHSYVIVHPHLFVTAR